MHYRNLSPILEEYPSLFILQQIEVYNLLSRLSKFKVTGDESRLIIVRCLNLSRCSLVHELQFVSNPGPLVEHKTIKNIRMTGSAACEIMPWEIAQHDQVIDEIDAFETKTFTQGKTS